jgi:hypothetical protein
MDGAGSLSIRWEFDAKKIVATFRVDGRTSIERLAGPNLDSDKTKTEGQLTGHALTDRTLTFAVRDGVAYVCEDGKPIVSLSVDSEKLEDWRRELPQSGCRIGISASQCNVSLSRIVVAQQIGLRTLKEIGMDGRALVRLAPDVKLASDEYYVVGDYAERSMDSRFWGPIKRIALFGVARWIYWPIARWHEFQ